MGKILNENMRNIYYTNNQLLIVLDQACPTHGLLAEKKKFQSHTVELIASHSVSLDLKRKKHSL